MGRSGSRSNMASASPLSSERDGEQQHFDNAAGAMQLAGDDEAIAAVVAFAANHGDATGGGVVLQDEIARWRCRRFPSR